MLDYKPFPTTTAVKAHLAINCIIATLMVIIVSLRIWSRIYSKAGLGWDDGLILVAMPMGIGMLVISGIWSRLGIGYPVTEVIVNLGLVLRLLFAYQILYCLVIGTAKLSVLCFYLRIFVEKKIRLVCKICMAFVVAGSFANLLQPFLMCRPFRGLYDPTVPAKCGDELASLIAMGVFQVATDMVILGLPIYTLWNLKMKSQKKVGLVGIFMIAFLTTLVGIVRLANLTTVKLKENLTGTMVWADFLTTLEPNLAILCVSLPMLAGVFKGWFGHGDRGTTLNYPNRAYGGSDVHSSNRQKFKKMDDSILMETVVDIRNETRSEEELVPAPSSSHGFDGSKKGAHVHAHALSQPWN